MENHNLKSKWRHLRKPEVENQGVSRVNFFWGLWGRNHPRLLSLCLVLTSSPWHSLACGYTTWISASIFASPLSRCVLCLIRTLLLDLGLWNPVWTHLHPYLHYILKEPISKQGHIVRSWVDSMLGDTIQSTIEVCLAWPSFPLKVIPSSTQQYHQVLRNTWLFTSAFTSDI